MKDGTCVFIGDVALDEYYSVERFPKLAEKVMTRQLEPQMGGMIANAACVYASCGARTRFLGLLNPRDRKLCDDLERASIDTSLTVYDASLPDSKCMIFLAEGEHVVFIIDMGVERFPITREIQRELCKAEIVYSFFAELMRLRLEDKGPLELVREWHENGVTLVCDTDVDKLSDEEKALLPYTEILFMNQVGFEGQRDGRTGEETAAYLLGLGLNMLVVTRAENGCDVYTKGEKFHMPGVPCEVVDVTGAGDTFCSSFTFLYAKTGDARLAAEYANYAASRSVTRMGARGGAAGMEAVFDYMRQNGRDPAAFIEAVAR